MKYLYKFNKLYFIIINNININKFIINYISIYIYIYMYVIIFVFYINYSFYVAFALLTSRTFLLNISFQFALNIPPNICGITKIKKRVLLVVFFCNKMSGLVNSGLYCYFNALIQSLSNSSNVHRLLQEHGNALECCDSKFLSFYGNIHEKYPPKKFVRKIQCQIFDGCFEKC